LLFSCVDFDDANIPVHKLDSNKGENAIPTESSEKGLQYPKHSSILYSFFHPQLPKYQMYLLLFDRVLTWPIQSQLIDVQDAFVPLST
jgi:hypothetical protein